jgi:hypothetical protein
MLTLVACTPTVRIGNILADPAHYANRSVKVSGNVGESFGFLGTGAYTVNDGTGTLWVLSQTGVPGKGVRVDSTGRIIQGADFGGRSFGVAMREQSHHTH